MDLHSRLFHGIDQLQFSFRYLYDFLDQAAADFVFDLADPVKSMLGSCRSTGAELPTKAYPKHSREAEFKGLTVIIRAAALVPIRSYHHLFLPVRSLPLQIAPPGDVLLSHHGDLQPMELVADRSTP